MGSAQYNNSKKTGREKTLEFFDGKIALAWEFYTGMETWLANVMGMMCPQRFKIKPSLATSGKHTITVFANKRDVKYPQSGHGVSSENGVGWNGILGQIELRAEADACIKDVQVYPNIRNNSVKVTLNIKGNILQDNDATLTFLIRKREKGESV